MEPERSGVEAFTVGFSGAADTTEVADEFEGGERVVPPGQLEALGEGFRGSIGNDMEEEIETGVSRGEEGSGHVLCKTHWG